MADADVVDVCDEGDVAAVAVIAIGLVGGNAGDEDALHLELAGAVEKLGIARHGLSVVAVRMVATDGDGICLLLADPVAGRGRTGVH